MTTVAPTEPLYATPEQVAALLQVSPKTVYRWSAQDPTMPTLRIGGVVRFPRDRILAWLRAREQGLGRPRRSLKPLHGAAEVRVGASVSTGENGACAVLCAVESADGR